jgi:hypothetical protein
MSENNHTRINPWLSIWISPGKTMRWIEQRDPDDMVIILASLAGFSEILVNASRFNLGDQISIPVIFAIAVVFGPFLGIAGLILISVLFWWTGSWLGGVSGLSMIRAALAWSCLPLICYSILWIPKYILLGDVLFESRVVIFGSKGHLLIVGFNVLRLIIVIWSIVIFLNCLAEVQKFGMWKAVVNTALSMFILILAVIFIAAVISVTIN